MPVFRLDERPVFPNPALAEPDGLLAVGGDLAPERLLRAYANGIFPWTAEGSYIPWYSPPWRMVLAPGDVHVSRSLARRLRRGDVQVRYDTDFDGVLAACAGAPRPGQAGTWITQEMRRAYRRLHDLGHAHSAEAWQAGRLVGGLYGVTLGGVFFGESMFAVVPDASKVAFVRAMRDLAGLGYVLVDCQVYTLHLASLGAEEWPRPIFLRALEAALAVVPSAVWPGSR
jgi:leucyl/phenylalanyl-tRNA--protein transferase